MQEPNHPKGATHYDAASGIYFKVDPDPSRFDGTQMIWLENKWMTTEWSSAFEATLEILK